MPLDIVRVVDRGTTFEDEMPVLALQLVAEALQNARVFNDVVGIKPEPFFPLTLVPSIAKQLDQPSFYTNHLHDDDLPRLYVCNHGSSREVLYYMDAHHPMRDTGRLDGFLYRYGKLARSSLRLPLTAKIESSDDFGRGMSVGMMRERDRHRKWSVVLRVTTKKSMPDLLNVVTSRDCIPARDKIYETMSVGGQCIYDEYRCVADMSFVAAGPSGDTGRLAMLDPHFPWQGSVDEIMEYVEEHVGDPSCCLRNPMFHAKFRERAWAAAEFEKEKARRAAMKRERAEGLEEEAKEAWKKARSELGEPSDDDDGDDGFSDDDDDDDEFWEKHTVRMTRWKAETASMMERKARGDGPAPTTAPAGAVADAVAGAAPPPEAVGTARGWLYLGVFEEGGVRKEHKIGCTMRTPEQRMKEESSRGTTGNKGRVLWQEEIPFPARLNDAERQAFMFRCETRLKELTRAFQTTGEYRKFDLESDWESVAVVRRKMMEAVRAEAATLA